MNYSIKSVSLLIITLVAFSAHAHVPFLKPNQFNVLHDRLQIESAFTELPFQADFAMDSPHFLMVNPDGSQTSLTPSAKTKAAVYLEPVLAGEGTYRISTGVRKGPEYNAVETAEGKLYFAEDMERVEGVPTKMQYFSSADTYITKDGSDYSPKALNKGVEIIPSSSPNQFFLGDAMSFSVLRDGKPVPNARIVVVYDNEHYEKHRIEDLYDVENERESNIFANEDGKFTFIPKKTGLVFLFVTVHEKINADLWESHNNSLTLEVNLPE